MKVDPASKTVEGPGPTTRVSFAADTTTTDPWLDSTANFIFLTPNSGWVLLRFRFKLAVAHARAVFQFSL